MVHVPILRHGDAYRSLDVAPVLDVRGGDPVGEVSLANAAMLRRDARRVEAGRAALREVGAEGLVAACVAAAERFRDGVLPVGDDAWSFEDWVAATSASTGLPHALVRANADKLVHVLREMPTILRGLTRGLPLGVLDDGLGDDDGVPVAYVPRTGALAAVLPSNSPGVHSLWLPALPLLTPVVLKPGHADPWTPLRLVEALVAGGVPRAALGFYPADRAVGPELVDQHGFAQVFGGPEIARRYAGRPGVDVHGPGHAKVLVGEDAVDRWEDHLDLLVASVASNGGRSCINASTIVVPRHGDALARGLAERLAQIVPRDLEDPDARLAATDAPAAEAIDAALTDALPGARDVSAEVRGPGRVVTLDGLTFLRPTVVRAPPGHALAKREWAFPFVSVVELPAADAVAWLGSTLVCTAITDDARLRRALLDAPHVDRLHLGAVPTSAIRWDQPHEGNLFEALWRRRAVAW
jgi:acyl-CoA reductase-like NAD-dependent aldehyde dehydrogenase